MTLSEFKAWFEGYTEVLEAAPTKAQFDRIKAKVAEITGTPISQTVFVDRYRHAWPSYPGIWQNPIVSYSVAGAVGQGTNNAVLMGMAQTAKGEAARYEAGKNQTVEWDSHAAMFAAGKADAMSNAA